MRAREDCVPREDSTTSISRGGAGADPAPAGDAPANPILPPELWSYIAGFLESPQDHKALSLVSRLRRDLVRDNGSIIHRRISTEMGQLEERDQAIVRALFDQAVDCENHPHYDILSFIDHFKSSPQPYRNPYVQLSPEEFTRRARALSTHAPVLLPKGMSADWRASIVNTALQHTADELTARATALTTHAPILLPEGMDAKWRTRIVYRALWHTAEEVTASTMALATHANTLLPEGMSAEWRTRIMYRALDLTAEELTARAMALAVHADILLPADMSADQRARIVNRAFNLTPEKIAARAKIFSRNQRLTSSSAAGI